MKFCAICGTQLSDDAVFCTNCGNSVEQKTESNAVQNDIAFGEGTTVLDTESIDDGTTVLNSNDFADNKAGFKTSDEVITPPPVYANSVEHQTNQVYQQYSNNVNQTQGMTFDEFYERFASKKTKGNAKWFKVIMIISAIASLVLIFLGSYLSIADLIVFGVAAILLLRKNKSWVLPLVITCYSGVFMIAELATGSTPTGIVAFIVCIMTTINFKKLNNAFKLYQTTGQVPSQPI